MISRPNDPSNQELLDRIETLEGTVSSFVGSVRRTLKVATIILTPGLAGFMLAFGNWLFKLFFK